MLRVLILSLPPFGIASRALTKRFKTALWNSAGSSRTGSRVGSRLISRSIVSPRARCSKGAASQHDPAHGLVLGALDPAPQLQQARRSGSFKGTFDLRHVR